MTRDQLLGLARGCANLEPEAKRRAVAGLVRMVVTTVPDSLGLRDPSGLLCAFAELLEEAYGDATGTEYWRGWVDFGDEHGLPKVIAAHRAAERIESGIDIGESDRASIYGLYLSDASGLIKEFPAGTIRDRLMTICGHPERAHRLPEALRGFLEPEAAPQAPVHLGVSGTRATQTPDVVEALRAIYPNPPPTANRKIMLKAVEERLRREVSLATLDRARKEAWR